MSKQNFRIYIFLLTFFSKLFKVARRRAKVVVDHMGGVVTSDCALGPNGNLPMSGLSLWWMLFVFMQIGIAEVFVNVTLYDYTYSYAPPRMRALAQGFCLLCQGSMSSSFSVVLNLLTEPWNRHADNNDNRLDLIYLVIAVIQIVGIGLIIPLAPEGPAKEFSVARYVTNVRKQMQKLENAFKKD